MAGSGHGAAAGSLVAAPASPAGGPAELRVLWRGRESYETTLALQRRLQDEVAAGGPEALVLVEHEPVITLGRRGDLRHVLAATAPVVRVSRGGDVTYHGPGQLVGYPIIDLRGRGRDVHRYLRDLETALIRVAGRFGIAATRRPGRTGVWCGPDKLAAIGIGVRRWVTMHGFALNVADVRPGFASIVPCGLADAGVTSLAVAGGVAPPLGAVARVVVEELRAALGARTRP